MKKMKFTRFLFNDFEIYKTSEIKQQTKTTNKLSSKRRFSYILNFEYIEYYNRANNLHRRVFIQRDYRLTTSNVYFDKKICSILCKSNQK